MGKSTELHNSKIDPKAAIAKAKQEIADERMSDAVGKLKTKLRELNSARNVVANIEREIEDLELAIEQGNA